MKYLSTAEAAEQMGCTTKTVYRMTRLYLVTRGKRGLRGFQPAGVQGSWKFTEADIDSFIQTGVSR